MYHRGKVSASEYLKVDKIGAICNEASLYKGERGIQQGKLSLERRIETAQGNTAAPADECRRELPCWTWSC